MGCKHPGYIKAWVEKKVFTYICIQCYTPYRGTA